MVNDNTDSRDELHIEEYSDISSNKGKNYKRTQTRKIKKNLSKEQDYDDESIDLSLYDEFSNAGGT